MSILTSALKGKGVQGAFCSLCATSSSSSTTTASRAFSSAIARSQISEAEFEDRRARGYERLQSDAIGREERRRGLLQNLVGHAKEWARDGVQPGSIMAERQEALDQGRRQPLPSGKVLNPGDLRKERMWPEPAQRRQTAMDAMGPNHQKALKTDYFRNIPTADGKGINPLNEYLNPQLLSHFVTNMGKIMPRAQTQLTWKNQRRLGKAIRRARAMGLMPYFGDWSDTTIKHAKMNKWGMPKTGRSA